jgi:hypothetical protein
VTDTRPNDPAPGPAPVLERLESTHEQIRYWLDEIKGLVDHMEQQGWDTWARDKARAVIAFFSNTGRQHHLDVDRQVLPLVAGRGDESVETDVERLRTDHGWIDEDWAELRAQLQPVAEGFGGYDVDTLRRAAEIFDDVLREKVEREKSLLPPAERALAEAKDGGDARDPKSRSTVG